MLRLVCKKKTISEVVLLFSYKMKQRKAPISLIATQMMLVIQDKRNGIIYAKCMCGGHLKLAPIIYGGH